MTAVAFPKPVRAPKKPRKSAKTSARGNNREPRPPGPNGASAPLPTPPAGRNSVGAAGTSSGDLEGCAFPKPVRQPKPRKHIQRKARLESKRRRRPRAVQAEAMFPKPVRPEGTAHGRRERGFGKMAYLATLPCMVLEAFWDTFTNEDVAAAESPAIPPPCRSRHIQVMHLRAEACQHRPTEKRVAPGCIGHHRDIDGREGGRGKWYVALGRINQRRFRDMLSELGEAYWMKLTTEQREDWDARAAAQMKARRV